MTKQSQSRLAGEAGYIGSHPAMGLVESKSIPVFAGDFSDTHGLIPQSLKQMTSQFVGRTLGSVQSKAHFQLLTRRSSRRISIYFNGFKLFANLVIEHARNDLVQALSSPGMSPRCSRVNRCLASRRCAELMGSAAIPETGNRTRVAGRSRLHRSSPERLCPLPPGVLFPRDVAMYRDATASRQLR
jgi:hypothetical protein